MVSPVFQRPSATGSTTLTPVSVAQSHRERLERQRRRDARRQVKSPPLERVEVPSVSWLGKPSIRYGLGAIIDFSGVSFFVDPRRFSPEADNVVLGQDFRAIGNDLRFVTDLVVSNQPRLFDVREYEVDSWPKT